MGNIARFNLKNISEAFNLKNFVETGTGKGDGIKYASELGVFNQLYSCEIHETVFKTIYKLNDNCHVYNASSIDFFKTIIDLIKDTPVLFWLDAHFPGADYGFANYNDNIDFHVKFPLESEIEWLSKNRDISKDVFIIDDWRVYEKLDWEDMNCYNKSLYDFGVDLPVDGVNIINTLMKTHKIDYDYRDQGYLFCTPEIKSA